jgi:hypothetical protein
MFTVGSGVTLVLGENITLKKTSDITLVDVYSNGKLVMKHGAKIDGNNLGGRGVFVTGGVFTMDGGEISGNEANEGAGVGVYMDGSFIMNGGEIKNNTAFSSSINNYNDVHGGGVYIQSGTFTMAGGKIYDNRCYTINNGSQNYNHNALGGGVAVGQSSYNFTMTGGEIYNNSAEGMAAFGGGVYVYGNFTMSGGKIYGNSATASRSNGYGGSNLPNMLFYGHGGGVYVTSGIFTMTNGEIYGNTATSVVSAADYESYGGGVYVRNGSFSKTQTSTITGYTSNAANGNVVKTGDPATVRNGRGHAVYVSNSDVPSIYKDGTSGSGDNLTLRGSNPPTGSWDN